MKQLLLILVLAGLVGCGRVNNIRPPDAMVSGLREKIEEQRGIARSVLSPEQFAQCNPLYDSMSHWAGCDRFYYWLDSNLILMHQFGWMKSCQLHDSKREEPLKTGEKEGEG